VLATTGGNIMNSMPLRVGVTPAHTCNYLPDQYEQLVVLMDENFRTPTGYETLLQTGFRRSGNDVYRPHCSHCSACHSLRIVADEFKPSRHQRRILKKNIDITWQLSHYDKPAYYALYERYIHQRHADGSMYPPSYSQYKQFLLSEWLEPCFLELHQGNKLIAVAVTDILPNSLSAMYTFYDPDFENRSIGTFAILTQLQLTLHMGRSYLYLGYQVDHCRKMNYKASYLPHERLINKVWEKYTITSD
jgi:arginyl-tRNA--protein-N-Asp/Glu arginylyltransferase